MDKEYEEALEESGEEPECDHDAGVRQDEEQLEASTHDLMATNQCPAELQPFINLTPDADYGCCLLVAWLVEFLDLKEGDSSEKDGFAWFYGPPHDREECIYQASVVDGVLRVAVEVGPEVLTRHANFQLFSAAPDVEGKGAE